MKSFKTLIAASAFALLVVSCGGNNSAETLAKAAHLTDSIAAAEADGKAVAADSDLMVSFTMPDAGIPLTAIGQDLFDVFAAQELKIVAPANVAAVCDALREVKGNLVVALNSPGGESAEFTLTPQDIIKLQRAKPSQLNLGAARNQLIDVAQQMVPNPDAHTGAVRVDVTVSKSFLEYNIIWPKASAYDKYPQGLLTKNYFNPLKKQYQQLGRLAEPVIAMLSAMGIDGVRVVYSAEDSDKQLKQAFPWREIRLPIEENTK